MIRPNRCQWVGFGVLIAASLCHAGSLASQPQSAPAAPPQAPVRVGGDIPPPVKVKDVKPVYPADAQQARAQGVVIIEATIDPTGQVRDAVVKRSIPLLDAAALNAVRQWVFTPTVVNGVAVAVIMTVTVNFTMQTPTAPSAPPMITTVRLMATRSVDGVMTVWEIAPEQASRLPRWNPAIATVPLSTVDVASAAEGWLLQHNPTVQRLELQSVTLSRVRWGRDIDFWFYHADFFAYGSVNRPPLKAVILPDGSIVEPRNESAAPVPPQ